MTDQTQQNDQTQHTNGTGPAPPAVGTAEDRAELALTGRVAMLENWARQTDSALQVLALGVLAGALTTLLIVILLRKKGVIGAIG